MSKLMNKLKEIQDQKMSGAKPESIIVKGVNATAAKNSQNKAESIPVAGKLLMGLGIFAAIFYIGFLIFDNLRSKDQLSDIKALLVANQKKIEVLTQQITKNTAAANSKLNSLNNDLEKTNKALNQGLQKNSMAISAVRSSVEDVKTRYNKLNEKVIDLKIKVETPRSLGAQ